MVYFRTGASRIFMDGKKPLGQIDIGIDFDNRSVVARKMDDYITQYTGRDNVYLGYEAASVCNRGSKNVMIGMNAGNQTNRLEEDSENKSSRNTFVGQDAGGQNTVGYDNVNIGASSGAFDDRGANHHNVNVGVDTGIVGNYVIVVGAENLASRSRSVLIGNSITEIDVDIAFDDNPLDESYEGSVIVGNNIENRGARSMLLYPNHVSGTHAEEQPPAFKNFTDDYLNIFNVLRGQTGFDDLEDGNTARERHGLVFDEPLRHLKEVDFIEPVYVRNELRIHQTVSEDYTDQNTIPTIEVAGLLRDLYETRERNRDFLLERVDADTFVRIFFERTNYNGLSSFNNDLGIEWAMSNQNIIKLGDFQNNLTLSDFPNTIAPWLPFDKGQLRLEDANVSDINLAALVNDGTFQLSLENLEELDFELIQNNTDILPQWITLDQREVLLKNFDPTGFADAYLKKVDLGIFRNDTYAWIRESQGDVALSRFFNDLRLSDLEDDLDLWQRIVDQLKADGSITAAVEATMDIIEDTTMDVIYRAMSDLHERSNVLYALLDRLSRTMDSNLNSIGGGGGGGGGGFGSGNAQGDVILSTDGSVFFDTTRFRIGDDFYYDGMIPMNDSRRTAFTLCNDLRVHGTIACGSVSIQPYEHIKRVIELADLHLDNATGVPQLVVGEDNSVSNATMVSTDQETVFLKPVYFLDEIHITSNLTIDPIFNQPVEMEQSLVVHGELAGLHPGLFPGSPCNLYVTSDVSITDSKLYWHHEPTGATWWAEINPQSNVPHTGDLEFHSINGSGFALTDTYEPNAMNFTGQHRCTSKVRMNNELANFIGKIVIATGEYSDLDNKHQVTINEAVPIVALCTTARDKRVFGVISDEEDDRMDRNFHFGYLRFTLKKRRRCRKITVNSVGEGAIWICDENGSLENGDFITSSSIPGLGMRQDENYVAPWTIGKITCDCSFEKDSKIYQYQEHIVKGKKSKQAFVGCTYKC